MSLDENQKPHAPKMAVIQLKVDIVQNLIKEYQNVTSREIKASLEISKMSIEKIVLNCMLKNFLLDNEFLD